MDRNYVDLWLSFLISNVNHSREATEHIFNLYTIFGKYLFKKELSGGKKKKPRSRFIATLVSRVFRFWEQASERNGEGEWTGRRHCFRTRSAPEISLRITLAPILAQSQPCFIENLKNVNSGDWFSRTTTIVKSIFFFILHLRARTQHVLPYKY